MGVNKSHFRVLIIPAFVTQWLSAWSWCLKNRSFMKLFRIPLLPSLKDLLHCGKPRSGVNNRHDSPLAASNWLILKDQFQWNWFPLFFIKTWKKTRDQNWQAARNLIGEQDKRGCSSSPTVELQWFEYESQDQRADRRITSLITTHLPFACGHWT